MNRTSFLNSKSILPSAILILAIVFVLAVVATPAMQAQTFKVIHTFTGRGDGAYPYTGLTIDAAGNLYGTTTEAGTGSGVVFKLTHLGAGWIRVPLYRFVGGDDGANPQGRVALTPDGTVYGTTLLGGGANSGTVFRLTPSSSSPRSAVAPWTGNCVPQVHRRYRWRRSPR